LVQFDNANGANPTDRLLQLGDGNFYGTTYWGGTNGLGTVFKVTPGGTLTSLVSFTNNNGARPFADLVQGSDGNFYGTTAIGGMSNDGTVYKIAADGTLTTLISFNYDNGANPQREMVLGSDGNLYGTCYSGGSGGGGNIFRVILAPALSVKRSNNSVILSWPSPSTGFQLESTPTLSGPSWIAILNVPSDDGTNKSVTLPVQPDQRYFRLFSQ
jgi:uncharacterized repeat protein (TIGR03803 family)